MSEPQQNRIQVNPVKLPNDATPREVELVRQINTQLTDIRAVLTKLDARLVALEP